MKLVKDLKITETDTSFKVQFRGFKKITSSNFPTLLGINRYNSIGSAILDRARLTIFEPIDVFYTIRGEIAEKLVFDYVKAYYKATKNVEIDLRAFNPKDYKGFDFYGEKSKLENKYFGGVPDMVISKPQEFRATIEVKTKSMNKYDEIVENKNIPYEELKQGEFLTTLNKQNKLIMAYVFLNEEQETKIKDLLKTKNANEIIEELGLTYKNVKIKLSFSDVDTNRIEGEMEQVKNMMLELATNNEIPKSLFREYEINIIKDYTNGDEKQENDLSQTIF